MQSGLGEDIFSRIRRSGLGGPKGPKDEKIQSAPISALEDLSEQLSVCTSSAKLTRAKNMYAHAASLSLGGGRQWCASLGCRLQRAHELAQFAALYSDRIYVDNFLSEYHWAPRATTAAGELALRQKFLDDLKVLYALKPCIEAGVIVPFSRPIGLCAHCLAGEHLGSDGRRRLSRLYTSLVRRHEEEIRITIQLERGLYIIAFDGPELLVDHGNARYSMTSPPSGLAEMPKILARVASGERVVLSHYARNNMDIDKMLADRVIQNVAFELTASQSLGSTFLTDRQIHISALEAIGGDASQARRNAVVRQHLTAMVPFLDDLSIDDLTKVRANEAESFLAFRTALTRAIDDYRSKTGAFTAATAKELYSDVIEPALARLDRSVRGARRTILKSAARSTLAWAGSISFGMYCGFVPADIVAAATALGMTQVLAELISSAGSVTDAEASARDDQFYFLWKVARKSKQKS
jgi:hypothetical protein